MTKRLIAIIIILLIPSVSYSQQGKIAPIKKGQTAPFDGLLYDYKADAVMSARRLATEERHKLEKKYASELQGAKHKAEMSAVVVSKEANEARYTEIGKIKDDRMTKLEKAANKKTYSTLWFSGGVIAGILVMLASAWALGEVVPAQHNGD